MLPPPTGWRYGVRAVRGQGCVAYEGSGVHDSVIDRLRAVDGELERLLALDELLRLGDDLRVEENHATYGHERRRVEVTHAAYERRRRGAAAALSSGAAAATQWRGKSARAAGDAYLRHGD